MTIPSNATAICARFANDPHRMLDILLAVQAQDRWISPATMEAIADATGLTRIAVEGVASFYAFLSLTPKGRVTIRLCDDIIDRFAGLDAVVAAFQDELGIQMGQTSPDGAFSLDYTPCIGMCDQAPAAMINDVVATGLTPDRARTIARALKSGQSPEWALMPDHASLTPYLRAKAMVADAVRLPGDVLLINKTILGPAIPFTEARLFSYAQPQRGDIITFTPPHVDITYVKRVIGVPGDRIRTDCNIVTQGSI